MNNVILGFNGERLDSASSNYHLGNGYRTYNPQLKRIICPDSWSPFGQGGINPYAYCAGDPINRADPSGHMSWQSGLGIGLSVLGLLGALFTAGASIAAAESVLTALEAASTVSLLAGSSAVAADLTGLASTLISQRNPEAAAVLGWLSFACGILSFGAGLASGGNKLSAGLRGDTTASSPRGPMMAATAASDDTYYLDGVRPYNFRLLGESPGHVWGGHDMWLDYSYYDYINGELRLNIAAHGDETRRIARIMLPEAGDDGFTATQAIRWLNNNNYPLRSGVIKRVRFLMCNGAKYGFGSFVAKFAEATNITATGWPESVWVGGRLDQLLTNLDTEFPGNRLFVEGVAQHFVESAAQTAELLNVNQGTPITYRPCLGGMMTQENGAYF